MSRERKVRTMNDRPADPSTDWLGERAWKAIARQAALDSFAFMLKGRAVGFQPEQQRQIIDGILGTIGPFYEAAVRDAVLAFIALDAGDDRVLEPLTEDLEAEQYDRIAAFLWRQVPAERIEELRRARR